MSLEEYYDHISNYCKCDKCGKEVPRDGLYTQVENGRTIEVCGSCYTGDMYK